MEIEPYLFFEGRCEEAIALYARVLGAVVEQISRFGEMPEPRPPGMVTPANEAKVMHARLRIGSSVMLVSDGMMQAPASFRGVSMSVAAADEAEAQRIFQGLGEGGSVRMPPGATFFARWFGMVEDRFGLGWMVIVEH